MTTENVKKFLNDSIKEKDTPENTAQEPKDEEVTDKKGPI